MTAKPPLQSGLTLIELMVAVAVLAILLSIGIPSFQSLVAQNRATSAANELQSTLQFARSTAIARDERLGVPSPPPGTPQSWRVTVCAADFGFSPPRCATGTTAVNWSGGWIVLQDGQTQPLRERRALGDTCALPLEPIFHRNASFFETAHVIPGQVQRTGAAARRQLRKGFFGAANLTDFLCMALDRLLDSRFGIWEYPFERSQFPAA